MNISSEKQIKVWAREGQYGKMYSIGVSEKQQDNTYKTSYIPVRFRKNVNVDNEEMIYIRSAWLKPTKDNGVAIFINEFEKVEDTARKALESDFLLDDGFDPNNITLSEDDDLPF